MVFFVKLFRWLFYLLVLAILAVFAIDSSMEIRYEKTQPSRNYRTAPVATVAIVPGAAVSGLKPSTILVDRLRCALYLYQNNKVRKILLSGDHGQKSYNELKPMLLFMLNNGVREQDIFVDHAGFRTLDTLVRAKVIFRVEDAIFVSQRFHQPRAHFIARKVGIRLYSYESDMRSYLKARNFRVREFFARTLAWLDLEIFHTTPKYLGDTYPIQGSGTTTWKGSL